MAFSFTIDSDRGVVRFTAGSVFSPRDVIASIEQVRNHPAFRPDFDHLIDLRGIKEYQPHADDIRQRSEYDRSDVRLDASRIAIVASSDIAYGMSRMYESLMEGATTTVHTFRDMAAAEAWLGLDVDAAKHR